ncbi:4'-phosphopantetheinyl transferase superfamily protein [Streptomyces sp. ET3-23]|uniref:4'-phosphopantetheinyl transferase family protein n=1 Tax=Streptomyces sp. ET3-23 TaxID=2885643 RepID=UPI001D0FFB7B|nr:4'-phosphopantetheinyl transferase superfamily protein [Streptomyces sp. ET3-23]MCC2278052.1 4'-phosphopantetheinyl transferase superfamily protein [Streptomyces sp. ET3-23]
MQLHLDPAAALRPEPSPAATPWPDAVAEPAEGALDLWLLHTPDAWLRSAVPDRSPLDAGERERAEAFVHDLDRAKYVAAHLMLRRVLGAYLGVAPGEVEFTREPCPCCGKPHGRPAVTAAGAPHFSMSHGGNLVLVGVAAAPVGVDTEQLAAAHTVEQVSQALHPAEHREVMAAPAVRRPAVFTRLWVRKEAYLKGLGTGLGRSPDLDYLGNGGPGTPAWPAGWTIVDVPVGTGHAAAAVRGPLTSRYEVRRLNPEGLCVTS